MKAPASVIEYIESFPDDVRDRLETMRSAILRAAPMAEEYISYGMPAYKLNGALVYFAAFKKHIGFYATPNAHEAFSGELSRYKTGKGSVQFPFDEPLPIDLIERMVKFRVTENLERTKTRGK